MLKGTAEYIYCISLKFFFKVKAEEEDERFLLARSKGKHLVHSHHEKRDHECAPETDEQADKSTHV